MRCLAKDPERRFASATELRRALQAGLVAERARREAHGGAAGVGAAPAPRRRAPPSRPRKPAAAARERRVVALLFFESKSNVAAIREAGTAVGAQLAHTAGVAVRARVRARGRRQPDARRRHRRRDVHRPRPREGGARRSGVGLGAGAPRRDAAATRARCSPRRSSIPATPIPRACCCRRPPSRCCPTRPARRSPTGPGSCGCRRPRRRRSGRRRAWASRRWSGATSCCARCIDLARGATTGAGPTITTLVGEPGHGKTHLAQMLVQHLEVSPRMQTIFVRAKEVLGGVGEQTTRELLQRTLALPDAAPADLGRGAAGGAAGRGDERGGLGGRRGGDGVGAARAPGAAFAGGGAGRVAFGGGARARRGAAPDRRAPSRWR